MSDLYWAFGIKTLYYYSYYSCCCCCTAHLDKSVEVRCERGHRLAMLSPFCEEREQLQLILEAVGCSRLQLVEEVTLAHADGG